MFSPESTFRSELERSTVTRCSMAMVMAPSKLEHDHHRHRIYSRLWISRRQPRWGNRYSWSRCFEWNVSTSFSETSAQLKLEWHIHAPVSVSAGGNNPREAIVADLRGNGSNDIITSDQSSAGITVILQITTALLKLRSSISTGKRSARTKHGDVNGDGIMDILG